MGQTRNLTVRKKGKTVLVAERNGNVLQSTDSELEEFWVTAFDEGVEQLVTVSEEKDGVFIEAVGIELVDPNDPEFLTALGRALITLGYEPSWNEIAKINEEDEGETRSDAATKFWSEHWHEMYPSSGKGRFVYHHHWRGLSEEETKLSDEELLNTSHSVHGDLRFEADDALWGFSVFLGTAAENKEADGDRLINLPQDDNLQGTFKLSQPKAWLDVGIDKPYVSEPGGVGATSKKYSKFFAIDHGTYEIGVWREHLFEVFLHGKKLKGRFLIEYAPVGGKRIWIIDRPKDQTPYAEQKNLEDVVAELKQKGQKYLIWSKPGEKPRKIDVTKYEIEKHLPGQHDQKTHGRRTVNRARMKEDWPRVGHRTPEEYFGRSMTEIPGNTPQERIRYVAEVMRHKLKNETGIELSQSEVESMFVSVRKWTGESYSSIRQYQQGKLKDAPQEVKDMASSIDRFIEVSPKFNAPVYRSISMNEEQLGSLRPGAVINMQGTSSWTSNQSVAEAFAALAGRGQVVTFRLGRTEWGTSISHLSLRPHEDEVLIHSKARFKVNSVRRSKGGVGGFVVDLEELSELAKEWLGYQQVNGLVILKAGTEFLSSQISLSKRWEIDNEIEVDDAIRKSNIEKHLPGKHDQKTHGRREGYLGKHTGKFNGEVEYEGTKEYVFEAAKRMYGRDMQPKELAMLAGAHDGEKVILSANAPDYFNAKIIHPDYEAKVSVIGIKGQTVYIEKMQAHKKGGSYGAKLIAQQISASEELGGNLSKITLGAEGKPGDKKWNGYYTWARLGFDGDIPRNVKKKLPEQFAGATKISQIMAAEGGAGWWKANGYAFNGVFDATQGSLSRKVLAGYLYGKGL